MIFYIVGAFLVLYSFFDYKKSFFLFVGFKFFLNGNITLVSIPGVPQLSLDLFLTGFYSLFYYSKKQFRKAKISFPLVTPCLIYSISNFLSMLFGIAGIGNEFSNFLKVLFLDCLMIFMIWEIIEDKNDFQDLFEIVTVVILISCLYGFFEYFIQSNPLSLYEMSLNGDSSKIANNLYEINARGYRINSIFEHCIGAGITWATYALFVLYGFIYYKNIINIKTYHYVVTVLAIICVFLTKMRSTFIFLAIGSLGLINVKKKRFYSIVIAVAFFLFVVFSNGLVPEEVIKIINSITNNEIQSEMSGSSLEMRMDQFSAAFEILKINPILGLGDKFQSVMKNDLTQRLWGSESVWLMAITRKGVIGIIAVVVQFYYMIIKIPKSCKCKSLFWLSLAYCVTYTVTSIPGTVMCWFYFVFSFFVKNSDRYNGLNSNRVDEWRFLETKIIHRKKVW